MQNFQQSNILKSLPKPQGHQEWPPLFIFENFLTHLRKFVKSVKSCYYLQTCILLHPLITYHLNQEGMTRLKPHSVVHTQVRVGTYLITVV